MASGTLIAYTRLPSSPTKIQAATRNTNIRTTSALHNIYSWRIPETFSSSITKPYEHGLGHSCKFSVQDDYRIKHAQKFSEIKRLLCMVTEENPFDGLILIDTLQHLNIDYHFQDETKAFLERNSMNTTVEHDGSGNLYELALHFRLLRQEGYYVNADIFRRFKDEEGNFRPELNEDVKGLMGLYEASQLRVEGETVLDEAENYSRQVLHAQLANLDENVARSVENTLKSPHHKSHAKFMAKNNFNNLKNTNRWTNILREFAVLDFKILQAIHQEEILEVSKWWEDLGLSKEFKFARDQPLKWYMWAMAAVPDPSHSQQRLELTKAISFIYVIDDIFDVYGSLDELHLFTEAIKRWDISNIGHLPRYMQICLMALYKVTNEICYKVYKEHGSNSIGILRKTWTSLCEAFFVEARWFAKGDLPDSEEYLRNGIVSSGVHVLLVHLFFLLGEGSKDETINLMDEIPTMILSPAKILRLWDDLGSAKDEHQDGQDGSYVECYMKEHAWISSQSARQHVLDMISQTWKSLNLDYLSPNSFSTSFRKAPLNIARMVPLMYNYDNNHNLPTLEEYAKSLLLEVL